MIQKVQENAFKKFFFYFLIGLYVPLNLTAGKGLLTSHKVWTEIDFLNSEFGLDNQAWQKPQTPLWAEYKDNYTII